MDGGGWWFGLFGYAFQCWLANGLPGGLPAEAGPLPACQRGFWFNEGPVNYHAYRSATHKIKSKEIKIYDLNNQHSEHEGRFDNVHGYCMTTMGFPALV